MDKATNFVGQPILSQILTCISGSKINSAAKNKIQIINTGNNYQSGPDDPDSYRIGVKLRNYSKVCDSRRDGILVENLTHQIQSPRGKKYSRQGRVGKAKK